MFARLEPVDVLYELDSPMIFTFLNGGHLHLAYMCGEVGGASRFVITPTNERVIASLRGGDISVREALAQPWLWCADVKPDGAVERCWITSPEDLPSKALPPHGVMLDPSLEPVFSVRVEGRFLGRDNVPASAIKRAVDGAYTALKKLSEATSGGASAGRPGKTWKRFFDLPAQHVAIGSFEIAFREPRVEQDGLPELGGVRERFQALTQDFAGALSWAVKGDGADASPRLQLLEAMEKLVPPRHGLIEKVYIGGRIFGAAERPFILDRDVTRKVRQALAFARVVQEEIKTVLGEARELDKDKMSFRLHEDSTGTDYVCQFQEDLYEDVLDVFTGDEMITVTLRVTKGTPVGEVVAISKA
ncbi:MAG: hypothetical protein HQL38_06520 [Alphaproteobacteria bacterium]|nr:hypothetical protein [Alphaproteobacteria bacterium]